MEPENFNRAFFLTKVIQVPRQKIATFWNTQIDYFIASPKSEQITILRRGQMICEKPLIINPVDLPRLFAGFSNEEIAFAEKLSPKFLSELRTLGYQFSHELAKVEEINNPEAELIKKIKEENSASFRLAIAVAPDDIWALSLIKVFIKVVKDSFRSNITDLDERGFFRSDEQVKRDEIEALFLQTLKNSYYKKELSQKLHEYNMFDDYQDRFFELINKV